MYFLVLRGLYNGFCWHKCNIPSNLSQMTTKFNCTCMFVFQIDYISLAAKLRNAMAIKKPHRCGLYWEYRMCSRNQRWFKWIPDGQLKIYIYLHIWPPSVNILIKGLQFWPLLSLRYSELENVGFDLTISPPPHPPDLLSPCLLWPVALPAPQED